MPPRRPILIAALALVLMGPAALVRAADEVVLVPKSTVKTSTPGRVRGQIQSESPTEVRIQATVGGPTTVPVDQIAEIRYDGLTPSFVLAETREGAGSLAEAADLYQKAAGEASGKPLVERAAQYARARLLAQLAEGDPARVSEAVSALDAFTTAHPDSRQIVPALETLARLALSTNDMTRADRATARLAAIPGAGDRATILQTRLLTRQGKSQEALSAIDRILTQLPAGSTDRREALLARAEALAGQKKFDEAREVVQQVIQDAPPEDPAQAAAYNTLGDCLRSAGKPKDALLAYLHTDILYSKDRDQHARALAQIVRLWRELNETTFANEALQRLKQQYPQSPWIATATGSGR